MRPAIDRLAQAIARSAMAVWFRDVETVGADRLPDRGPTLIVASHFNGLLDPALVVLTSPRTPHFLAKSSLWRNPVAARLLDFFEVLPVQRASEGDTARNVDVFAACEAALERGDSVALFPEGITHDEPRVTRLRTGAARLALGAWRRGVRGVCIVPVGLVYTAKASPRSRALVRVSEPVDLDHLVESSQADDDETLARELTEVLRDRLAQAALDYDDADVALVATRAADITLRPPDAPRGWQPSLHELERRARALVAAPIHAQAEVVRRFLAYHDALALLGVTDADLVAGVVTPRILRLRLTTLAGLGAIAPLALVGAAVNGPAVAAVWAAGKRPATAPMRGTARVLTGMAALPASWAALRWWLGRKSGLREPTLLTAAAGPGCGLIALSLLERALALRSGRESAQRLREHQAVLPALWAEREALVTAVEDALAAPARDRGRDGGRDGDAPPGSAHSSA